MKLFISIIGLVWAPLALAIDASPCREVEYMQLKTASKKELQEEYCFAKIHAESEARIHEIVQETISKKRQIPADTSRDEADSLSLLKSVGSCRSRAAQFEVALSRRFKSKPPASCD